MTILFVAEKMHKKNPNLSQNNAFFPNQSGTGTIPKVGKKTLLHAKYISSVVIHNKIIYVCFHKACHPHGRANVYLND
jgi:hypothetical protein